MRQRGARLSFLGGKRKGSQQSTNGDTPSSTQLNGENSESNSQRSKSKENLTPVMPTQSIDTNSSSNHHHRNGNIDSIPNRSRKSKEMVDIVEGDFSRSGEGGIMRIRSVRKRLSILKLGKKPSKTNGIV
jgi:hypothetical protein